MEFTDHICKLNRKWPPLCWPEKNQIRARARDLAIHCRSRTHGKLIENVSYVVDLRGNGFFIFILGGACYLAINLETNVRGPLLVGSQSRNSLLICLVKSSTSFYLDHCFERVHFYADIYLA